MCVNYPHYIFVYFPTKFLMFFLLIIRTLQINQFVITKLEDTSPYLTFELLFWETLNHVAS